MTQKITFNYKYEKFLFDKKANVTGTEQATPHHGFRDDGTLWVSGEDGSGEIDYWGEFRGGYAYISEGLEDWAKTRGGHWEWNDPGSISFYFD
jgi:hypothetical protein